MKMLALLRGINVGGTRKVPMAGLRDLATGAGLAEVETYIQSGNLVFEAGRTGAPVSLRNWRTVLQLSEMLA